MVFWVYFFRAVPPLVILIIFYFAFPYIGIRLSGFVAVYISMSLVLAAFAEEIFWAGILSVDKGHWEAARSTGLGFAAALVNVVLPQAFRMTIPPLTKGRELKLNISTPDNPDMLWMQERSSDLVKQ